ncbi:MAG: type II toxin-antitoxin system Phd/YefM family antitoxin [Dermatophilaceae bacterium]
MTTMPVTEARRRLREVVDLARSGEDVNLTVHGEVVAVLVSPDALRTRRTTPATEQAASVLHDLHRAREARAPLVPGMTRRRASALVAQVRQDRDAE